MKSLRVALNIKPRANETTQGSPRNETSLDTLGPDAEDYELLQKPPPTPPADEVSHFSPVTQSSRCKRRRSSRELPCLGQVASSQLDSPGCPLPSLYGAALGDDADGDQRGMVATAGVQTYTLKPDHPLQGIRSTVTRLALDEIHKWMATARYIEPPDNRFSPLKRSRTATWQQCSGYVEEALPDDTEAVVLSRIQGYLHLACPYYVSNPAKYLSCLQHNDLQSVEDVIQHLRRNHTQPPYCPRCRQTFRAATDRDRHFYARVCASRSSCKIDGVTAQQWADLVEQDQSKAGERRRWRLAWAAIFPDDQRHQSPYLDGPAERAVSMTRDYWNSHGMSLVFQQLMAHNLVVGDDEDDTNSLVAFLSDILNDLITKVLGDYGVL